MEGLSEFAPATRTWFEASFEAPTEAQELGWPAIAAGGHTLIHAPTGSGKTLAAFLWAIDRLLHEPTPARAERCRVLYVSPMKALAYDVERNLRAPLVGIRRAAADADLPEITTAMRTGDTPAADRQRMLRTPPDILITTPESLYLMLTSQARRMFGSVRWVIVDEIHAVAGTKRGAHLSLSLERLEELTRGHPQRIGLSATQRPISEIAAFLGGGTVRSDGTWEPRPVTIVDAPGKRALDLELVVPVEDMAAPAAPDDPDGYRSIWPAVYPRILELIETNRSTIVFANSRRLAERICAEINDLAGREIAKAHHGSVSRSQRVAIEESLKRGDLAAVVATSSLELGIDMGTVDLVIQVESPTSVASGIQRVGRSGHHVGGTSRATIFPKYRADLLEATVVVDRMHRRLIEATRIPSHPLDVLAQQIVATVANEEITTEALYGLVRRAAPYRSLGVKPFEAVLDMLAGRYPSDLFAELRPRIVWDRVADRITGRPGAKQIAVQNAGTIPDRGYYPVVLPDGTRIGELDEEMVYESRVGDTFLLGATTWRINEITPDRVEVVPAPADPAPRMPFWHGDTLGRPAETGRALGEFLRHMTSLDAETARAELQDRYHLDGRAARNLLAYLKEQQEGSVVPTDRTIVVERFRDEIGDWRLVILSPFGARVHAPWAMALTQVLRTRYGYDVNVIWADDGIAFRFADANDPPADVQVDPEEVESLLIDHLADTALFAARFREAAARALLLPRRRPGKRTPLWLQRRRAADLQAVARQFGSFPIILETFRETLQDDFDLPALHQILTDARARRIRVVNVETSAPSPFASSLLFDFVAAYLYEGDAPLAERRAAALSLDRGLLRELLGEGELRELISAEVVEAVELELQRLTPGRHITTPDGICDLLRDLGPMTTDEVADRSALEDLGGALTALESARRIIRVRAPGSQGWAAIEDAGRLRDAQGLQPPRGVPDAFLEPVPDPLGDVVGRYARTHGPFTVEQASTRLQLPPAVVLQALGALEREARVTRGTFHRGEPQWVDTEVLRRLKRRTLASLRQEIEPVDQATLGRFLPAWQGVGAPVSGTTAALSRVVGQLQGAAIPGSILERDVLSARLEYSPDLLDHLMVSGDVVWVGAGGLGLRDGRVRLFFRDQVERFAEDEPQSSPEGPVHEAIRIHLRSRGASFFRDLYAGAGGGDPAVVLDALWDLVWAGEVTNDTLAPLRSYLLGKAKRSGRAVAPSSFPPSSSGRWWMTGDLRTEPDATVTATAQALQLLERHGLVVREVVRAEGTPGGFTGLYPVLNRLEETGRARRGYFVEGLGGIQFALPGAVDRLRSETGRDDSLVLAAADPANPYGAALQWPEAASARRPARTAGSYVILWNGSLVVFLERRGRTALTFTDDPDALRAGADAMTSLAARNRRLRLETIDGQPAQDTRLGRSMTDLGFVASYKGGLVLR